MNRDVLSRRLEKQGYTVITAEDGQVALDLIQRDLFDLILLDIMMPRMNGYQVLEHLKAHPLQRSVPIIVISAMDDLESVVRCIELGAEDYLFKPFNPVLLRARLNAILSKKRLRETLSPDQVNAMHHQLDTLAAEPLSPAQAAALDALRSLIDSGGSAAP
jgi:DNA-binding response OmpR family regulator